MRKPSAPFIAILGLVLVTPLVAHHSVPAVFDEGKQITLTGTISKIQWINPHIHLFLATKAPDGKATTWEIETLPTNWMRNAGITKDAVLGNAAAGEVVTIHANPARDTSLNLGYLMRITYPDGHFLHVTGDPEKIAPVK
jgi:hypothetical protein